MSERAFSAVNELTAKVHAAFEGCLNKEHQPTLPSSQITHRFSAPAQIKRSVFGGVTQKADIAWCVCDQTKLSVYSTGNHKLIRELKFVATSSSELLNIDDVSEGIYNGRRCLIASVSNDIIAELRVIYLAVDTVHHKISLPERVKLLLHVQITPEEKSAEHHLIAVDVKGRFYRVDLDSAVCTRLSGSKPLENSDARPTVAQYAHHLEAIVVGFSDGSFRISAWPEAKHNIVFVPNQDKCAPVSALVYHRLKPDEGILWVGTSSDKRGGHTKSSDPLVSLYKITRGGASGNQLYKIEDLRITSSLRAVDDANELTIFDSFLLEDPNDPGVPLLVNKHYESRRPIAAFATKSIRDDNTKAKIWLLETPPCYGEPPLVKTYYIPSSFQKQNLFNVALRRNSVVDYIHLCREFKVVKENPGERGFNSLEKRLYGGSYAFSLDAVGRYGRHEITYDSFQSRVKSVFAERAAACLAVPQTTVRFCEQAGFFEVQPGEHLDETEEGARFFLLVMALEFGLSTSIGNYIGKTYTDQLSNKYYLDQPVEIIRWVEAHYASVVEQDDCIVLLDRSRGFVHCLNALLSTRAITDESRDKAQQLLSKITLRQKCAQVKYWFGYTAVGDTNLREWCYSELPKRLPRWSEQYKQTRQSRQVGSKNKGMVKPVSIFIDTLVSNIPATRHCEPLYPPHDFPSLLEFGEPADFDQSFCSKSTVEDQVNDDVISQKLLVIFYFLLDLESDLKKSSDFEKEPKFADSFANTFSISRNQSALLKAFHLIDKLLPGELKQTIDLTYFGKVAQTPQLQQWSGQILKTLCTLDRFREVYVFASLLDRSQFAGETVEIYLNALLQRKSWLDALKYLRDTHSKEIRMVVKRWAAFFDSCLLQNEMRDLFALPLSPKESRRLIIYLKNKSHKSRGFLVIYYFHTNKLCEGIWLHEQMKKQIVSGKIRDSNAIADDTIVTQYRKCVPDGVYERYLEMHKHDDLPRLQHFDVPPLEERKLQPPANFGNMEIDSDDSNLQDRCYSPIPRTTPDITTPNVSILTSSAGHMRYEPKEYKSPNSEDATSRSIDRTITPRRAPDSRGDVKASLERARARGRRQKAKKKAAQEIDERGQYAVGTSHVQPEPENLDKTEPADESISPEPKSRLFSQFQAVE